MPELPEVEVLVRHLAPLLTGRRIREVLVHRPRVIRPQAPGAFASELRGATLAGVWRRGKYLVFDLLRPPGQTALLLIGHLGMTGRMYLQTAGAPLARHAAVVFDLGEARWVFEDLRYFGRFLLDEAVLANLGPEPLEAGFTTDHLARGLLRSRRAVKPLLLDQRLVAGLGNIYASESLHRAGLSPRRAAHRLGRAEIGRLHAAIRSTLRQAIHLGSTLPLDFAGQGSRDGLFYYGSDAATPADDVERLQVYDRAGEPCHQCGTAIRRIVQSGRSTFYCPTCQR